MLPAAASADPPRLLLEFGAGPTIPVTTYFDVGVEDGFATVENSTHAALGLSLIIKGFTVRYGANFVHLGEFKREWPTTSLNKLNGVITSIGGNPLPKQESGQVNDEIVFHSLAVGYRFYFLDGRFQPYLPLEVGMVAVGGEPLEDKTLYGATLATGVGLDIQIWKAFFVGIAARYSFVITEAIPETALVGFTSNSPSFEHSVAMAHLISVTAQAQVRF